MGQAMLIDVQVRSLRYAGATALRLGGPMRDRSYYEKRAAEMRQIASESVSAKLRQDLLETAKELEAKAASLPKGPIRPEAA